MPWSHVNCIWACSFLSLATSLYGFSQGPSHHDVAAVPFGVFATSFIFWWDPRPGFNWPRVIDISWVQVGMWYLVFRAAQSEKPAEFYAALATAGSSFIPSQHFHTRVQWLSTLGHVGVHVLGNVANVLLFKSSLPSPPPVATASIRRLVRGCLARCMWCIIARFLRRRTLSGHQHSVQGSKQCERGQVQEARWPLKRR